MRLLCAIVDRLAESVGPVMSYPAPAAAIRSFGDVASDPQTLLSKHVADFDLLCLGELDDRSGVVTPNNPPVVMLTGAQWLAAQRPETAGADGQLSLLKEA